MHVPNFVPNFSHFAPGFSPPSFFPPSHPVPVQYPPNPMHNQLPIQYVYVPMPPNSVPSEAAALPSTSKSLPVITSIPILNIKTDFYAWDEGVSMLLRHLGIHGHFLDPTVPIDPQHPDMSSSRRPTLSGTPMPLELAALNRWNDNDNVAQYVLIGRLGSLARQLLPPTGERTALVIYKSICKYFGLRNFTDCTELATSLQNLHCEHNKVQDYIARWNFSPLLRKFSFQCPCLYQ